MKRQINAIIKKMVELKNEIETLNVNSMSRVDFDLQEKKFEELEKLEKVVRKWRKSGTAQERQQKEQLLFEALKINDIKFLCNIF